MPSAIGTQPLPQEKLAQQLDAMDEALVNLRVLYEKYFLGIDRKPPDRERKQVSDTMRVLKTTMVKNTALKFRINTMFAKLISMERLWDRTLREIEEGTYKRVGSNTWHRIAFRLVCATNKDLRQAIEEGEFRN